MHTLPNCENKSMFSLANKAQWIKALKEIDIVFMDSGHFSINGTKISSHHLFIGILYSVSGGGVLPPQQHCLLAEDIFWPAYKSGIFKLFVVWSFMFWFCNFVLEKLIHWKQISPKSSISSKIFKQWLRNILINCQSRNWSDTLTSLMFSSNPVMNFKPG